MVHLPNLIRIILMFITANLVLNATDQPVRLRVALVMDDGPFPTHNAELLALLARENVRMTFSHVGREVAAHPEMCRAAAAAGHEIANHSYTHPHIKDLDDETVRREVRDTQAAIVQATGLAPKWFWAPFLEEDDRLVAAVRSAGLEYFPRSRFHFISTDDWDPAVDAATVRHRATTGIQDATVILMHEWPKTTFAELPAILVELKRQGAVFVTFSELAGAK